MGARSPFVGGGYGEKWGQVSICREEWRRGVGSKAEWGQKWRNEMEKWGQVSICRRVRREMGPGLHLSRGVEAWSGVKGGVGSKAEWGQRRSGVFCPLQNHSRAHWKWPHNLSLRALSSRLTLPFEPGRFLCEVPLVEISHHPADDPPQEAGKRHGERHLGSVTRSRRLCPVIRFDSCAGRAEPKPSTRFQRGDRPLGGRNGARSPFVGGVDAWCGSQVFSPLHIIRSLRRTSAAETSLTGFVAEFLNSREKT